ncbi:MAG: helix-turn-helix domain-containing protein, partial [Acidobacteria bacterium]|nr:helix-turn-helix domain-containing protein [Acidobacteriota bacterium]
MLLTEKELYSAQIEKIADSSVLHGSESLRKLLRYLAGYALDHPGGHLKEYQIATEVFGRAADFDSQLDSTVRVQVGRLRQKLQEYYRSEGSHDEILVDLPKGTYLLGFHHQLPVPEILQSSQKEEGTNPSPIRPAVLVPPARGTWSGVTTALLVLLLAALAVIAVLLLSRSASPPARTDAEAPSAAVSVFWKQFVEGREEPWVVFSNASFVGRPETGMRYLDRSRDANAKVFDHYTGVGEVLAVHELDRVFASLHREIRVKRGSLLSLDDVKNND